MPRKSEWPPRPKLHAASGQLRVWVGGRYEYLGPEGSEEAKAAYAALLAKIASGEVRQQPPPRQQSSGLTVAGVVARWLREEAPARVRQRGREVEQFELSFKPLLRLFGTDPAASFDTHSLLRLQRAMADGSWLTQEERVNCPMRRKYGAGWCRKVVNQRLNRVRAVWRWAELARLVPQGRYAALQAVPNLQPGTPAAKDHAEQEPADWDEVRAICRRAAPVVRSMLLFQWWTGCRTAEMRIMRAGDVDEASRQYRPRQHKTDYRGHTRIVAIGPRAWAVLRPWLERARAAGPDAVVFPCSRGRGGRKATDGFTRNGFCQAVGRAAERAGVESFRAYRCRHAAAKRVREAAGDEQARAVLGQRSLAVNLRYAATPDAALARKTQEKLG